MARRAVPRRRRGERGLGTAFWGHTYTSFDEVSPPRGVGGAPNPASHSDFERYSSDALFAHYVAEREVIEQHSDVPVTTNFMVGGGLGLALVDYAGWARHVAIPANDHYTLVDDPDRAEDLAASADRMRASPAVGPRGCSWSTRPGAELAAAQPCEGAR